MKTKLVTMILMLMLIGVPAFGRDLDFNGVDVNGEPVESDPVVEVDFSNVEMPPKPPSFGIPKVEQTFVIEAPNTPVNPGRVAEQNEDTAIFSIELPPNPGEKK